MEQMEQMEQGETSRGEISLLSTRKLTAKSRRRSVLTQPVKPTEEKGRKKFVVRGRAHESTTVSK